MPTFDDGFEKFEENFRKQLAGKTLLGEIPFDEQYCDLLAEMFKGPLTQLGLGRGLQWIRARLPITFAMWLVNEAYYGYDGGLWPIVLPKLGLQHQPQSALLGKLFIEIIEAHKLPRFAKLNTKWSYLGPILAHCGIPKSRLPEFFEVVLPEAARIGVSSPEGLAEFEDHLEELRVAKVIDWFVRFGEKTSAEFLRRSVDMYRLARDGSDLPPAAALGLPERVRAAFADWRKTADIQGPESTRSRLRRPRLYVDPSQGLRLELPSQPCAPSHSELQWEIQVDSEANQLRRAPRFVGDTRTQADDVLLPKAFASVVVRLADPVGRALGIWVLNGVSPELPVIYFDPATTSLLPSQQVAAGVVGMMHPVGWSVALEPTTDAKTASVLSNLGTLPFGWSAFRAAIFDLSGGTKVRFIDEQSSDRGALELAEQLALPPRIDGVDVPFLIAPDRARVFSGSAPALLVAATPDEFSRDWRLRVSPVSHLCEAAPPVVTPPSETLLTEAVDRDGKAWLRVPLDQPSLLGSRPWGVFDIAATGPMGQALRTRIATLPSIRLSHDWAEWRQGEMVQARLSTNAQLTGADVRRVNHETWALPVGDGRAPLRVQFAGYGEQRWSIPLDLRLPMPSWSVFDEGAAAHLVTWSSRPASVTLPDADGRAPWLLARLETPWGIPHAVTASLCYHDRVLLSVPVPMEQGGFARLDLQRVMADARRAGLPRTSLRLDLELARTVSLQCLWIEHTWTVDNLSVASDGSDLRVTWNERIPVHGRVLRAYYLLQPWEAPRTVALGDHQSGVWQGSLDTLVSEAGRYRFELGLEDEWTGNYQSAASAEWDHGHAEEWEAAPLAGDSSVDGVLYRLLVAAASGRPLLPGHNAVGTDERAEELATKALLARQAVAKAPAVARQLDGLLMRRVDLWPLLRGVLAAGAAVSPRTLLELGVLTRPRFGAEGVPLSDERADAIWRFWEPLGAWADLHAVEATGSQAAWMRMTRRLGEQALSTLPTTLRPRVDEFVIAQIKNNNGTFLRGLLEHCRPFPSSPIGDEAFQVAGFEWTIAVAENLAKRGDLEALCRETDPLCAEARAASDVAPEHLPVLARLRGELQARFHPLFRDTPLLATHEVSWLLASLMVWRSLGRLPFATCSETQLAQLSTRLFDIAPALLAHDIVKVCAIEALHTLQSNHAPEPQLADQ